MDDISTQKADARRRLLEERSRIDELARGQAAEAVARHLASIEAVASARTVLSYAPTDQELDPNGFADDLPSPPSLAFPRVVDSVSLAIHTCPPHTLTAGHRGICEPQPTAPPTDPDTIDVILVPGVGFDRAGHRMGYGKGFYDRFLSTLPERPLLIGISFDETLKDAIPFEHHDVAMDVVVTPQGIWWI